MKLSISNIAWRTEEDEAAYRLLATLGVGAIEIAPTRIWPAWEGVTPQAAAAFAKQLRAYALTVSSFQALLFGRSELTLFESETSRRALQAHLLHVADLAAAMGATRLVFGSPKNRLRKTLPLAEAQKIAVDTFRTLGEACASRNVILCIEPNPAAYGCDFINTTAEALALVSEVDSPGFRLHFDSGAAFMNHEDTAALLPQCAPYLGHMHISQPELADFSAPHPQHVLVATALRQIEWNGWTAIEMPAKERGLEAVAEALSFANRVYGLHPPI